jgi:hypothetical protein
MKRANSLGIGRRRTTRVAVAAMYGQINIRTALYLHTKLSVRIRSHPHIICYFRTYISPSRHRESLGLQERGYVEQALNAGGITAICRNPAVCLFRDILARGFVR